MLLTVPEAAISLRISRSYLYQLILAGEFPSVRIGRAVRIAAADLEEWVAVRRGGYVAPGTDVPSLNR